MIKYFGQAYHQTDYLLRHSYIYLLLHEILTFFTILIKERSLKASVKVVFFEHGGEAVNKFRTKRQKKRITNFNDMKTIIYMVIGYVGVTKIGIERSFYTLLAFNVIDFLLRLALVTMVFIFKRVVGSEFRKLFLSDK